MQDRGCDSAEPSRPAPAPPGHGPKIRGPLHTCGTQILNAAGRSLRILAVGLTSMKEGAGPPGEQGLAATGCEGWVAPTRQDAANVAGAGLNAVRLAISWANLEPVPPTMGGGGRLIHHYNRAYLSAMDRAIDNFTGRGVAVILHMNQVRWSPAFKDLPDFTGKREFCQGTGMPAWFYRTGGLEEMVAAEKAFFLHPKSTIRRRFLQMWRFVVGRYADRPKVIGVDLLNEPYDLLNAPYPNVSDLKPADMDLAGFYEQVGRAIRAVNPKLLLFFQDNLSRRSGLWAVTRRPDLPNAVYSPHFYQETWDEVARARLTRYLRRSRSWDLPIWLGELTRFGTDPGWRSSLQAALAWCRQREVGWAVQSYRPEWFIPGYPSPQPGIVSVIRGGF